MLSFSLQKSQRAVEQIWICSSLAFLYCLWACLLMKEKTGISECVLCFEYDCIYRWCFSGSVCSFSFCFCGFGMFAFSACLWHVDCWACKCKQTFTTAPLQAGCGGSPLCAISHSHRGFEQGRILGGSGPEPHRLLLLQYCCNRVIGIHNFEGV